MQSQKTSQRPQEASATSKPFVETYKTSYSHGLETIYSLENVDLKSVRRMESPTLPVKKTLKKTFISASFQLNLDLGEEFRGWIPSFVKNEPIQVLELTKFAEKNLIENGKLLLKDLVGENPGDLISPPRMSQGHLEELSHKLKDYLKENPIDVCRKIDFISWLKTLLFAQDRKKVCILLEFYDLSDFVSLSPGEGIEVQKLLLEKRREWAEELLKKICDPKQKQTVRSHMQSLVNVFFKPWIRRRGGLVSRYELEERLLRISADAHSTPSIIRFFQEHFLDGKDLFKEFLFEADKNLFTCDTHSIEEYEFIIKQTLSYFYKPSIHYSIGELTSFIEIELAKKWIGFPEGYIRKILMLSPQFQIHRAISGTIEIRCKAQKDVVAKLE